MVNDYLPVQPFNFCPSFHNYIIPPDHPLYGTILEIYELDTRDLAGSDYSTWFFPDACVNILYFTRGGKTRGYIQGSYPVISPYSLDPDSVLVGERFAIGQFSRLCDRPASEYLSGNLGLENVCIFHEEITAKLSSKCSFKEKCDYLSDCLVTNISQKNRLLPCIPVIVDRVLASRGSIRCGALAQELGYSDRQLRNLVSRYIGLSPKQLCSIVQFQYAVGAFTSHEDLTNEQVSYMFNYHDTSHMNKAFHKLTGLSPKEFYRQYLMPAEPGQQAEIKSRFCFSQSSIS